MATYTLTVNIKLAWWLKVYLNTLHALCYLMDCEPNMDRAGYWISKGVSVKAK